MRRLTYTDAAQDDLLAIFEYIARESSSLAIGRGFVDQLRDQCVYLASLPGELGRARPELRTDIRSFAFKNYVIFFRYLPDQFEVINVLQGHRDIVAYFSDDDKT